MIPTLHGVMDPTAASGTAPLLVLGPSLGTVAGAWSTVAAQLAATHRVLRYDLPGHGASPVTAEPFTTAELAQAVVALVDSVGGGSFSYAGVSLGGAVGIELALGPDADRLEALAIVCSNAKLATPQSWTDRAAQVRQQGTASMVRGSAERWFAPGFLTRDPDAGGRLLNQLLDIDDEGYSLCCEALAALDRSADVPNIRARTLVVHGDVDPVVPIAAATALADGIPGSSRVQLDDTAHQPQVERPAELAAVLGAFLTPDDPDSEKYVSGLAVRREVLSSPYVDASLDGITPETEDFQRFITEFAWGSVWTRPGLDRRMRSAVTISSLVTGHHWHELELHLHAGLRNGLSRDELVEILLQTAIYAGVPAANSAFGVAKTVFAAVDGETSETDKE